MGLSRQSLLFLQDLLNRTNINTGAPNWRNTAQLTAQAQDELALELRRFDSQGAEKGDAEGGPVAQSANGADQPAQV
jgi:hypothetical protein